MIVVSTKDEILTSLRSLQESTVDNTLSLVIGGMKYVEHAILTKEKEETIGVATVAPRGGDMSSEPTLLAIYVAPAYRQRGVGFKLLSASVDFMISRGFCPVRIDVQTPILSRLINRLPAENRAKLLVIDHSRRGRFPAHPSDT